MADRITNRVGKLAETTSGVVAFVPTPLNPPPEIGSSASLDSLIRAIYAEAAVLQERPVPRSLGSVLLSMQLESEALASSRIEGIDSDLVDVWILRELGQVRPGSPEYAIANYVGAVTLGFRLVQSREPLSTQMLLRLHRRLFMKMQSGITVGRLRSVQAFVSSDENSGIARAAFVPPPPDALPSLMADLDHWFATRTDKLNSVLALAVTHAQLLSVHPFEDGNGRTSRIASSLEAVSLCLLREPILGLGEVFAARRAAYYSALTRLRESGSWEEWVAFFAESALDSLRVLRSRRSATIEAIDGLRDEFDRAFGRLGRRSLAWVLRHRVVNPPRLGQHLNLTTDEIARSAERLLERGVLETVRLPADTRLYVVPSLIRIWASKSSAPKEARGQETKVVSGGGKEDPER